jgi:hypothetical protein
MFLYGLRNVVDPLVTIGTYHDPSATSYTDPVLMRSDGSLEDLCGYEWYPSGILRSAQALLTECEECKDHLESLGSAALPLCAIAIIDRKVSPQKVESTAFIFPPNS